MTTEHAWFTEADAACERGDHQQALAIFQREAEQGSALAMSRLAVMYYTGQGVPVDIPQSIAWDLRAVDAGDTLSLYNLGVSYRALGDIRQARAWFERAQAAGDLSAALALAQLYLVSDKESATVRHYLQAVLAGTPWQDVSQDDFDEARRLLQGLDADGASPRRGPFD